MKQSKFIIISRYVISAGLTYMVYHTAGLWVAIAIGFLFLGQEVQGKAVQNLARKLLKGDEEIGETREVF